MSVPGHVFSFIVPNVSGILSEHFSHLEQKREVHFSPGLCIDLSSLPSQCSRHVPLFLCFFFLPALSKCL